MIKKIAAIGLSLALMTGLTGCYSTHELDFEGEVQSTQSKLATASILSDEELYERAKEEVKENKFMIYSSTSITENVVENFEKAYPELSEKVHFRDLDDENEYDELITSMEENTDEVDVLISHSDLVKVLTEKGEVYGYYPISKKDAVGDEYGKPMPFMFSSSVFMYDSSKGKLSLDNIWGLTEAEYKGKILMKDPRNEQVNMEFFYMLSSPTWTQKLKDAYKEYYGTEWKSGAYNTISAEWTYKFIDNCVFPEEYSSADIIKALLEDDEQKIALVGYSKFRKLDEDEKSRISVFGLEDDVEGFSGFAFGTYAMVAHDTPCPYTCALFINYILSEEGFSGEGAWNNYPGYYSTNQTIEKSLANDENFDYWRQRLIVEDTSYIKDQNDRMKSYIEKCIERAQKSARRG